MSKIQDFIKIPQLYGFFSELGTHVFGLMYRSEYGTFTLIDKKNRMISSKILLHYSIKQERLPLELVFFHVQSFLDSRGVNLKIKIIFDLFYFKKMKFLIV